MPRFLTALPVYNEAAHVSAVLDEVLRPLYLIGTRLAARLHFFQAGNIHAYLSYIVFFLIVLLLWR